VTEWRPSGPEPGKDGPGNLSRPALTAINRPEGRNASRSATRFALSNAFNLTPDSVIILTAAPGPDGVTPGRP
jgi:hypothetical protein